MSHTVGGNLVAAERIRRPVVPLRRGHRLVDRDVAVESARAIFNAWMGSSPHRALILSDRFNYIGVGLAHRSSNGRRRSRRRCSPRPPTTRGRRSRDGRAARSGDDVRWTWSATTRASRRTPPGCATTTLRTGSTTAAGGSSATTHHDVADAGRPRPRRVVRHPGAGHRPAWQCGRMEQRVAYLGALTGPSGGTRSPPSTSSATRSTGTSSSPSG